MNRISFQIWYSPHLITSKSDQLTDIKTSARSEVAVRTGEIPQHPCVKGPFAKGALHKRTDSFTEMNLVIGLQYFGSYIIDTLDDMAWNNVALIKIMLA